MAGSKTSSKAPVPKEVNTVHGEGAGKRARNPETRER